MIDDIWEYGEPKGEETRWSYRGALRKQKNGHSAITIGDATHVFGGLGK